jgi:hypothetical protein
MDLKDYQQKMQQGTGGGEVEKDLAKAAKSMEAGSMDMRQTSQQQVMQMQFLAQSIQQQQQSINNLASSINSMGVTQRSAQPTAPVRPIQPQSGGMAGSVGPMMSAAGQNVAAVGGMAANYAVARAEEVRQQATQMIRGGMAYGNPGSHPGMLNVPQASTFGLINQTLGASYNPASAQNYSFGAYQRAMGSNVGQGAQNVAAGIYGAASSTFGVGAALGAVGGMLVGGPIGSMVGSVVGSAIGGKIDQVANPFVLANEQIEKTMAFGSRAAQSSNNFLRGGGAGRTAGTFSTGQQMQIGMGMAKDTMMDLSFGNNQIMEMQESFSSSGQMTGVKDAKQYRQRMKSLLDNSKYIMQTLQATSEEAMDMMDKMYNQMGANAGAGAGAMTTRLYAASLTSGMSTTQVADMMGRGAASANNHGLRADTGAANTAMAIGLSGIASGNINQSLLVGIGGQDGLTDMIAQKNMQFMGGMGGTMMALGGKFGGDIHGGMSRTANAIGGSGDMVSFLADRHNKVANISPEAAQAQQFMMMNSMANQMGGVGGTTEDRMKLLAQGQGMNGVEAQAFIEAGMSMPENMSKQMRAVSQQRSDYQSSQMAEQFGFGGRMKRGYREFAFGDGLEIGGVRMGVGGVTNSVADSVSQGSGHLSDVFEAGYADLQDKFYGIEGRGHFSGAQRIQERLDSGASPRSSGGFAGIRNVGAGVSANLSEYTDDPMSSSSLTNEIKDALSGGNTTRLKQIAGMVKSGSTVDKFGMGFEKGVSNEDVQALVRGAGVTDKKNLKTLNALAPSTVSGGFNSGHMNKDERIEKLKGILGSGFSEQEGEEALGSPGFMKFVNNMKKLMKLFSSGDQKQSKEYKVVEAQAIGDYDSLDGAAKKLADRFMSKFGISIDGSRITMRRSGFDNMSVYEKIKDGLGYNVDDGNLGAFSAAADLGDLGESAQSSQDAEQEVASIQSSLGAFGKNVKLDKSAGLEGQMDLVGGVMAGVDDEKLMSVYKDKEQSAGVRNAARIEHNRRLNGADSPLDKQQSEEMVRSLISGGLADTEGSYVEGTEKLKGKGTVGAQMEETSKINRETVRQMVELSKIIESMKRERK